MQTLTGAESVEYIIFNTVGFSQGLKDEIDKNPNLKLVGKIFVKLLGGSRANKRKKIYGNVVNAKMSCVVKKYYEYKKRLEKAFAIWYN